MFPRASLSMTFFLAWFFLESTIVDPKSTIMSYYELESIFFLPKMYWFTSYQQKGEIADLTYPYKRPSSSYTPQFWIQSNPSPRLATTQGENDQSAVLFNQYLVVEKKWIRVFFLPCHPFTLKGVRWTTENSASILTMQSISPREYNSVSLKSKRIALSKSEEWIW